MDLKELKLYAGNVVIESKLSNAAKMQALKFLKEANSSQVKVFIMDGKIVKLDEQSEQIVNDRFEAIYEASNI